MNLFDKIIQSQFNNFTGQAQPQVPSFDTPQAPRTTNYTQPNIPTATVKKTSPVVRNGGFAPGYEGTVDETQSGLFKVIQGGADLFTGIKKRLGETVQEDKTRFDTEMSQKRQQFISDMLAKGKKKEDIFSALDSLKAKGEFDFKPGISESIVGGVGNRMQTIENETTRLSQIQDPLARTTAGILPYAGQTVATALQPVTSALEPFVSPVVQAVIKKTGQTENIQALSEGWNEFEKTNPILAENIAGLLNVSQLAPLPFAKPVGNAIKTGTVETGKAIVRGAEIVAPKVVQGVKTGVRATEEGIGKVTKSIVSQQSGLGTPAIESILKRPELQGKIRSGELSGAKTLEEARSSIDALREGYRETGKMYDTVRKSNVKVGTSEAKQVLLSQLESEGLATGGKLNLVDLPVKDRGAITQALKYIDEYKGEMTPQSALSIRQKLDDLINYKSDVGSNGQRIVQGLRTKYDEFLGSKLPGLKEIDAKYAPERQFWESIRKDIYKADGTLKDNALSVVSNITNKGNEARLARMESILPGIGEKVKALKAFDDIQAASGIKVGTYGRAATTGAIALVNIPLAIASWVVTHPVVVARVLESIGLASQKIKSILAKGKNITKEDATIIQQAVAKTPKSKVESIINNLSYDPKTSKLTSKTLIKNANNSVRPVAISNKGDVRKVEQVKTIVKPNTIKNESKVTEPVVVPKKTVNTPIVKKSGVEAKVEIAKEGNIDTKSSKDIDSQIYDIKRKLSGLRQKQDVTGKEIPEIRELENKIEMLQSNKSEIVNSQSFTPNGFHSDYKLHGEELLNPAPGVMYTSKTGDIYIPIKEKSNSILAYNKTKGKYEIIPGLENQDGIKFYKDWHKRGFVSRNFDFDGKTVGDVINNLPQSIPKKITPQSNAKQQGIKPKSSDTIPEVTPKVIGKEVKYTPEQRAAIMDKGEYDKGFYDKIVKEGKTSDDLLSSEFMFGPEDKYVLRNNAVNKRYNELLKQENNDKIATLQKQIENTKDIKPGSLDNRIKRETETYNFHNDNAKTDIGLAKEYEQSQADYYKKKIELLQKANGTIPEGYFKNAFGEIQKNPSNKKGGFIKIPEIGKKVEPIIEEAKKYKSAEEFINSTKNISKAKQGEPIIIEGFHGTGFKFDDFDKKYIGKNYLQSEGGFFFTKNVKQAERYAGISASSIAKVPALSKAGMELKGNVMKRSIVMKKPIVRQVDSEYISPADFYDDHRVDLMRDARIENYDGIIIKGTKGDDLIVALEPEQIKTESQLKQIYNQSKSIVKNPLVEEARKYKSAEEFADDVDFSNKWEDFAAKPFRKDYEIAGLKMKYTGNSENRTHGFVNDYNFIKDGKIIGDITVGKNPRDGKIHIVGIDLNENIRGVGLGTNIIKDIIKKFDATGFKEGTWATNRAGKFWMKLHNMGLSEGQKGTIPFVEFYKQVK